MTTTPDVLWAAVHAERTALAADLADPDDDQWAQPSLCGGWSVEDVVAHLTAAASVGRLRWLTSVERPRRQAEVSRTVVRTSAATKRPPGPA